MRVIDYNGAGRWAADAVEQRYRSYCARLKCSPGDVEPRRHSAEGIVWVYPVMDRMIQRIEADDPAAVLIGVEFVEEDQSFAFGKILKSNTARALRRATLTAAQQEQLRARFTDMLLRGYLPREYKEYAKLFRKIGLGGHREEIATRADLSNSFVSRYYHYLMASDAGRQPSRHRDRP